MSTQNEMIFEKSNQLFDPTVEAISYVQIPDNSNISPPVNRFKVLASKRWSNKSKIKDDNVLKTDAAIHKRQQNYLNGQQQEINQRKKDLDDREATMNAKYLSIENDYNVKASALSIR
uniref:Uncharacterized protein n=1 Tax=Panagrolaimus sp. ES5 TaxID=591445 RepID=A0AC34GFN1_9BILA